MEQMTAVSWSQVNFLLNLATVTLNTIVILVFVWHTRDLKLQVADVRRVLIHRTSLFLTIAEAIRDREIAQDLRRQLDHLIEELRRMNIEEGHHPSGEHPDDDMDIHVLKRESL